MNRKSLGRGRPLFEATIRAGALLGVLLILCVASAAAQQASTGAGSISTNARATTAHDGDSGATTTLDGTVRMASGEGIPGAAVRATLTGTTKAWVTWTDDSGKFEFPSIPAGRYTLAAEQLGFVKIERAVQVAAGLPPPPIQLTLRVATVEDLEAPPGSARPTNRWAARPGRPGGYPGAGGGQAPASNRAGTGTEAGRRGRFDGSGQQLPAGVVNALNQGLASGGFQQTELTGDSAANEGTDEIAGAGANSAPAMSAAGASTSDAFLLQGTVGQGLSATGPRGFGPGGRGGPGGFGQVGLTPPSPGGPGGPGGQTVQGGPGGGGPGAQEGPGGGPPGGGNRAFVARGVGGGRGPMLFAGRGGMFFRQQVNRMRFTFYDRLDDSAFDARPYAITGEPSPKLGHYDDRFGLNLGGPLRIPHIYNGSDKTYFFANYQHDIQSSAVNTFSTVPTLDERSGFFCGASLYEPFSNPSTPFPTVADSNCTGGLAQQVSINAAAAGLLAYIPKPNLAASVQDFLLQATLPENTDNLNVHVLHTLNAKWNLNGGYNFESMRGNTLSNFPGIGGNQSTRDQNVDLGVSHNWSPRLVESTSINWSRSRLQSLSDNSYGTNIAANLGITGVSGQPIDYGIPQISLTNFSSINDPIPLLVRNQTFRIDDGLTWVHAAHTMQFGGEIRRLQFNTDSSPNPRGQFVFTGLLTSQLNASGAPVTGTGNDFADFLLGLPFNTSEQFGNPNTYFRSWGFAGYAQDDWRVNKVFTFEYGLRYDAVTPPVELFNNIANLDMNPAIATIAASGATCLDCVQLVQPGGGGPFSGAFPTALIHGDYHNFAPRIGFAWQPKFIKPRTVVRGGYSIFYNESGYDTLARELAYQPPVSTAQTLTTSQAGTLTLENGFLPSQSTSGLITNTEAVDPFYKNAYAQIWTLGTETSISQNWILDLTYTGTKGTNLDVLRAPNRAPLGTQQNDIQANRVDPNATGFTYDQSGANSIYNALQVRVMHRFTHGLMLQGIYTYGKSLDDASSIGGGTGTVEQIDGDLAAERGLSTFDIRNQMRVFSMYELPFGQRSRWANHGWTERLFGDWRLMNIFTWQTGMPYTALLGGTASDNGTGANFSLRAEQFGNPNTGICGGSPLSYFNTSVFGLPATDTYGNERRGAIEGPCTLSWNMSVAKTFRFGPERRHMLNVQWQMQNLTNTPSFNGLGTVYGSSFFGQVTSASSMRTMSLMARFNF
ncbi:MAG TPA: TonB-dependent receptor [Candidatus Dormibacteraeota bacterium]|nr:TonB-dependent receptor [Candidatus Dormibacteraeota bacterium]